ncbi:hypothetical protein B0T24DRAFT_620785 [Lasiosphaeria ovina]|uniref:Uncharacterized protein n=1 Tax=Lasiosphaeria ovina TaxID=92902 RepID=A0AAE0KIA1_9PEZI|nr:hypothetical protein B0T24DRAFT_620785 [Lasiosphaeria ovina]
MASSHFSPRHIPALILASTTTLGGFWPMLNAHSAMLAFGFPPHLAEAPAAHPVMLQGQSRSTILGALIFTLYFRRRYAEIDTLMAIMGFWGGAVDAFVVWRHGRPEKAFFRLVTLWSFAAIGLAGLTASSG